MVFRGGSPPPAGITPRARKQLQTLHFLKEGARWSGNTPHAHGRAIILVRDDHMTHAQQSDAMKKLVWFMIGLAILGTIIALAWYFAVDLPLWQAALQVPKNC
jgi:hypothetical protein